MCSGVEVRRMVLDQTVDNDGEEVWGKVGMFAIGLRYDVDERWKVCRENSVSCRVKLVHVKDKAVGLGIPSKGQGTKETLGSEHRTG